MDRRKIGRDGRRKGGREENIGEATRKGKGKEGR